MGSLIFHQSVESLSVRYLVSTGILWMQVWADFGVYSIRHCTGCIIILGDGFNSIFLKWIPAYCHNNNNKKITLYFCCCRCNHGGVFQMCFLPAPSIFLLYFPMWICVRGWRSQWRHRIERCRDQWRHRIDQTRDGGFGSTHQARSNERWRNGEKSWKYGRQVKYLKNIFGVQKL